MKQLRTISDVEDTINEFVIEYGRKKWNLPPHAARVLLWPTDRWRVNITSGPTAIIRIGCARTIEQDFRLVLVGAERKRELTVADEYLTLLAVHVKDAVDHVAKYHSYSCLTIERTADIIRRDEQGKRYRRVHFGFDEELIPHMLHEDEIIIRHLERVEVEHRGTGLREVMEVEMGKARSISVFTMLQLAKSRLARSVHTQKVEVA